MKEKKTVNKLFENRCDTCKWYNKESEREYVRRLGKDKHEVKEIRVLCRNSNIKTYNRRINRNSVKQCFEKGTYKPPKEESKKKVKKKKKINEKRGGEYKAPNTNFPS